MLFTTCYFAEPINSEHDELLEPESVIVNNGVVLSKLPRNKKPYLQDGLMGNLRLKAKLVVLG